MTRKAFDPVYWSIVVFKVRCYSVGGWTNSLVEWWLDGCAQRKGVNNLYSLWRSVASGVPQGFILRPILFHVLTNNLDKVRECTFIKFVEDAELWFTVGMLQGRALNDTSVRINGVNN